MAISIVKTQAEVIALIGAISTKQGDYRNGVTSAVLSAVAHSLENSETDMIKKLLNEMFTNAYRDLKVVTKFLQSVTPIVIEEVKEGRRTKAVVTACQFEKNNFDKEGKTAKESNELSVKALKRHNGRVDLFTTFCDPNGEIKVRNMEWKEGDDKANKTIPVKYASDIFAWFEDVEYIRKEVEKGKDADAIDPFVVLVKDAYENAQNPIVSALKALEALKAEDRTSEIAADITALQEIATRIAAHVTSREAERKQAVEVATLEKIGAAKKQITAWINQRAKRVTEGKDAANIETEFNAYVEALKSKPAKAEAKAA